MGDFLQHNKYLFVFAHPDEEIYTCVTIQRLALQNKTVHVLYVTSGDYNGPKLVEIREKEALEAVQLLGIKSENVRFLRIPEKRLMSELKDVRGQIEQIVAAFDSDCLVTHDFEGGHNGHDAVSYVATKAARILPTYTFPAYHDWPERRKYNRFISQHPATETFRLDNEQKDLKRSVMNVHASQKRFMDEILDSDSREQFFDHEKLRKLDEPYDYTKAPTDPVGYEFPGSPIRFADFISAIERV